MSFFSDIYKSRHELLSYSHWIGFKLIFLAALVLTALYMGVLEPEFMSVPLRNLSIIIVIAGVWLVSFAVTYRLYRWCRHR